MPKERINILIQPETRQFIKKFCQDPIGVFVDEIVGRILKKQDLFKEEYKKTVEISTKQLFQVCACCKKPQKEIGTKDMILFFHGDSTTSYCRTCFTTPIKDLLERGVSPFKPGADITKYEWNESFEDMSIEWKECGSVALYDWNIQITKGVIYEKLLKEAEK